MHFVGLQFHVAEFSIIFVSIFAAIVDKLELSLRKVEIIHECRELWNTGGLSCGDSSYHWTDGSVPGLSASVARACFEVALIGDYDKL